MKTHFMKYFLIASVILCLVFICVYAFITSRPLLYMLVKEYVNGRHAKSGEYPAFSEDSQSEQSYQNVTIFCWILSMTSNLKDKAAAVNSTWAPRCNKYVFVISAEKAKPEGRTVTNDQQTSAYVEHDILYINSPEGYFKLIPKVKKVMQYLYEKELHNYDWFLKADDDSYFIIENLRYLLSKHDPSKGLYLGYALEPTVSSKSVLYMSGGAGYVFSREGIRLMVENGYNVGACKESTEFEDLEIGKCAKIAGVTAVNTIDKLDRETFHPDHLKDFIPGPPKAWLNFYAKNKPKGGPDCCSQYSISFHRMSYQDILIFDHLLYKTNVYGRRNLRNDTDVFKDRKA
ncbi:hypothetical protein ACJMK2_000238 [Sinanodonta woodiana]|uniref:N-acetylgalactosaminide beta-1,3-galactosyltransferase n=1 Tax=Sinanodonta woodiana TaxID=1069815 RepID=A0ABD3XN52_SINWO